MSDDTAGATGDPKPAAEQSDDDVLAEARDRYRLCGEAYDFNYDEARADLKFLVGGNNQWPDEVVAARTLMKRPMITVNVLPTYLHQVTNDQRMNSPSIKVHPVDDKADLETARVIQGLIRHVEYDSNADVAYDTAVNSAAACGFGYFRGTTDYESDSSMNQCLKIERIANPLSVKIDPLSTEPDGSDMQYAFVEYLMSRDEFKREYPDAEANNTSLTAEGNYASWFPEKSVLICDYYRIEKVAATVVQLITGESGFKDDLFPKGMKVPAGMIAKERKGTKCKVMVRKITAVDVLEETEIKSPWIPVFPVYGDEVNIDGKIYRAGIIRNAKGPAQMYNVMMTSATEEVALRSKTPWIMAEGQQQGHEKEWAASNTLPLPYITYKPVSLDGKLAPPPQRNQMADVPTGMLALAMHSADNIKKTTGLFDASLGARGSATSGKQELAQQREGDMANFHYSDGLNRTIRHVGRWILSMVPTTYDTQRVVRILGEDDSAEYVTVNDPNVNGKPDESGAIRKVLNDLTVGKYDITVSSGPSYSTLRQEAADGMSAIMEKNPAAWGVFGDLFVRSMDWPNAEEIAKRIEKTIPPNLLDKEDGEEQEQVIETAQGPLPVSQVPQALEALQMELAQLQEALQKADASRQQAEVMKQQQALNEQQFEPARIEAERLAAQAALTSAQAATVKAEADRLRAQAELATAPERARAELLKARTEGVRAVHEANQPLETPGDGDAAPDTPDPMSPNDMVPTLGETLQGVADIVQASKQPLPTGMTITAPSGLTYDVRLH